VVGLGFRDFSTNELWGGFPPEYGNLRNLETLYVRIFFPPSSLLLQIDYRSLRSNLLTNNIVGLLCSWLWENELSGYFPDEYQALVKVNDL
jgi:hypothetical protein